MQRTQKIAMLSGLGLVGVIVTVFALVIAFFPDHPAVSVTATAATGVAPSATAVRLTSSATPNPLAAWQKVTTLPNPTSIAFSDSTPLTGYQCGGSGPLGSGATLSLSVTRDGGATWGALLAMPGQNVGCTLRVNPLDPADLVATETACFPGCTGPVSDNYYRSRDGGHTWNQLVIPHPSSAKLAFVQPKSSGAAPGSILAYSWAGPTLYVIGIPYDNTNTFTLYQSRNGGPLARLDLTQNPTSAGVAQQNQLSAILFSLEHTIYLTFAGSCVPHCPFLTSADDGATWQTIASPSAGILGEIASAADGKTLMSAEQTGNNTQQPIISRDGGHTWQPLPALPDGYDLHAANIMASTPDGSLFVGVGDGHLVAFFQLTAGTNSWRLEYTNPQPSSTQAYPYLTTVSATANGQPKTIWGAILSGSDVNQLYQRPA
jgi:hypothetical protein